MNLGENEENLAIFKIILFASCETRNGFCQLYLFERILIRPKNCKDVNMTVLEIKSFFSNLFFPFFLGRHLKENLIVGRNWLPACWTCS